MDASILFAKKKNGDLQIYINYRDLNFKIIKNRYLLSLIKNLLNRLAGAEIFIKLNIKHAYHRLRIREDNE